ncbi:hypothetical protein BT96DRAFT_921044 [Gymnopus androsaceus JB14]|uniref:Aminoglycoside phosphotransferase domain-containing protein n=1 Tax=Gymnopus androsaceus JB14 TaxID=1447944 RepID=A0A6A4HHM9_9AGAR|nr:hypothetical protein BT96DRAFT_921044 [Gymnopus androsaceus JB14]
MSTETNAHEISEQVSEEDEDLTAVLEKIHQIDFYKHAVELRPGFTPVVSIPADASSLQHGGMNVHIPLTFSDGVEWLARVRLESAPGAKLIMKSEIETMRVLKASGLSVPNAFKPKDPDVDFFFVEFLNGSACTAPIADGTLTDQQQRNLIRSIASFYVSLSGIKFAQVGSVIREPVTNELKVGPLISPDFCQDDPPFFFGPFESSTHRYLAHIERVIREIEQGSAFTDDPPSAYVAHLWLRDLIQNTPRLAYTASKSEAFAAPLALVDVEAFFNGVNELSPNEEELAKAYEESGRADLAACVSAGKVYQPPDVVTEKTIEEWVAAKINGPYGGKVAALKLSTQK